MTLTPFEVRRALLDMTTHDTLTFGRLSVRLHKARMTVRWQIDMPGKSQAYRYPRYTDVHTVSAMLTQVVGYIMANYAGERLDNPDQCPVCGAPVVSRKATYCSAECRVTAYQRRKRASA